MKLKCIGGSCDGQSLWVDHDYLVIGDRKPVIKHQYSRFEDFNPSEPIPKTIEYNVEYYQIDCLKYSYSKDKEPNEIWFLRPPNLTTFDAIQFQFLK